MFRWFYISASRLVDDEADEVVRDIVKVSVARNRALGVTGALLSQDGISRNIWRVRPEGWTSCGRASAWTCGTKISGRSPKENIRIGDLSHGRWPICLLHNFCHQEPKSC